MLRRYEFKLYTTYDQDAVLHRQRMMVADLWNALLERHEEIKRRTQQHQLWMDRDGKHHVGYSIHCTTWVTERYKTGERCVIEPGENGYPKPYTRFDMTNEITFMLNEMP